MSYNPSHVTINLNQGLFACRIFMLLIFVPHLHRKCLSDTISSHLEMFQYLIDETSLSILSFNSLLKNQRVVMGLVLSHWLLLDNLKFFNGLHISATVLLCSLLLYISCVILFRLIWQACSSRLEWRTSMWLCSWPMHRYLMSGFWS